MPYVPSIRHASPSRRFILTRGLAFTLSMASSAPARAASPLRQFTPVGNEDIDHVLFDTILQRNVVTDTENYNRVDYRQIKADARRELKSYIDSLQQVVPSRLRPDAAHAYWINLYNSVTIAIVLEHYPIDTIRAIRLGGRLFATGPWSADVVNVDGRALSLDDIEHRIIRPLFDEPLSHYALNCASRSCPNLMNRSFREDNLYELMTINAANYVNHPRGVRVKDGQIAASRLYLWYDDDFGGRRNLKGHWTEFADRKHAQAIAGASLGRFHYDWGLNDV